MEWITFCILVALALGFEFLNYKLPTEKRNVIEKITNHFKTHKPESAIRGNKNG